MQQSVKELQQVPQPRWHTLPEKSPEAMEKKDDVL